MNLGIPALVYTADGGTTYEPAPMSNFAAYYNLGESPAEVPFPENLQMVAGDATATSMANSPEDAKVEWFCEGDPKSPLDENGFPSEGCSTHLQTLLYFPSCVNVDTLEVSYKSSSYGTANYCPAGQSSMPQLRFSIRYDLRDALPSGWSGTAPVKLACGGAWCHHGDFINGWTVEAAQNMLATTESKMDFSPVNGALGNDGDMPTCEATDAEPGKGTSDYGESVKQLGKRTVESWGWKSWSRFLR